MGTIKQISKFPYSGPAYNILVTGAENGNRGIKQNFFDGLVHPDYIVYNNDGRIQRVADLTAESHILNRDGTLWCVESLLTYTVNEDFQQIEFTDGRTLKCSQQHKLMVTSPKKISASELDGGDIIADVSLASVKKKAKNFRSF